MKPEPLEEQYPVLLEVFRWWENYANGPANIKYVVQEYARNHGKMVVKLKEPGRNDPCPCGSGKKYKKCCWG